MISSHERRPAFVPGEVLCERFRIARLVGRGGMGDVYEADDLELGVTVALKTIRDDVAQDPATLRRFKREVSLARQVTHPNVCRVFDLFAHHPATGGETKHLLTMELLRGDTLAQRLRERGRLPSDEALGVIRQMIEGLAAAHRAGVVHRDLKASNVFLVPSDDGGERVVIADFGLACSPEPDGGDDDSTATAPDRLFGTPAYVSPEQLQGQPTGPASDVYSLGVVMYEMVTGARPFEGPSPLSAAVRRLVEDPTPPRRLVRRLPARWQSVILRCLARDPRRRFASVEEILPALTGERLRGPLSRRSAGAVAAAAAVLAVAVGLMWWRSGPSSSHRPAVAVMGVHDLRDDSADGWLEPALTEMLASELAVDQQLRLVPGEEVARVRLELGLGTTATYSRDSLAQLRRLLGSDYVLGGTFLVEEDTDRRVVRLDLRVQQTRSGSVAASTSILGEQDRLFELVSTAGRRLRRQLGLSAVSDETLALARGLMPRSPEATRLYVQGLERLHAMDALAARDLLQRAAAAEPDFPLAHTALAAAWADLGYAERARQSAADAVRQADGLPREQRLVVEAQLREAEADWQAACEIYRSLWTFFPDNPWYGLRLAEAQLASGAAGDARATLAVLQRGADGRPGPQVDLVAARTADAVGDPRAQLQLATRAAAAAHELGARLLYARARHQEGLALWELGRADEARDAVTEASVVFHAVGDRRREARAAVSLGVFNKAVGDLDQASADYASAVEIGTSIGDASVTATALTALADLEMDRGDLTRALDHAERALELRQDLGDVRLQARSLRQRASVLRRQGHLDAALADYRRAREILQQVGDRDAEAGALNSIAVVERQLGRLDEAARTLRQVAAVKEEIGDRREMATPLVNLGNVLLELGRIDPAEAAFRRALGVAEDIGSERHRSYALFGLGEVALARGDLEAARRRHLDALESRVGSGHDAAAASSRLALALVALAAGDGATATELTAQVEAEIGESVPPDLECWAHAVAARTALAAGDVATARRRADAASAALGDDRSARFFVAVTTARVEVAEGRPSQAVRRLGEALEWCERDRSAPGRMECLLELADAERAAGRAEDARLHLDEAHGLASELGYRRLQQAAERRLSDL